MSDCSASSEASTLRSDRSGSPPRLNPSTTTEPSPNFATRSASRTAARTRSEPVVQRMRQLTSELAKLRAEVELPSAPIHGDYKLANLGELPGGSWVTFDLDFARIRERLYDIAATLHHMSPDGELREPQRLLGAYQSTAPEPLTRDEHRWLPGALALIPALGCHRRARRRPHPRRRERNERRRDMVVPPSRTLAVGPNRASLLHDRAARGDEPTFTGPEKVREVLPGLCGVRCQEIQRQRAKRPISDHPCRSAAFPWGYPRHEKRSPSHDPQQPSRARPRETRPSPRALTF